MEQQQQPPFSRYPFILHNFKLKRQGNNILGVAPAINSTYLCHSVTRHYKHELLHYSQHNSQIMWRYPLKGNALNFQMLNDHTVVNWNSTQNSIEVISLKTYRVNTIKHDLFDMDSIVSLFTFPDTSSFLIAEEYQPRIFKVQAKLKLTYYSVDYNTNHAQVLLIKENRWNSVIGLGNVRKLNRRSKIWWKVISQDKDDYCFFDREAPPTRQCRCFTYPQGQQEQTHLDILWEIKYDQFYCVKQVEVQGQFDRVITEVGVLFEEQNQWKLRHLQCLNYTANWEPQKVILKSYRGFTDYLLIVMRKEGQEQRQKDHLMLFGHKSEDLVYSEQFELKNKRHWGLQGNDFFALEYTVKDGYFNINLLDFSKPMKDVYMQFLLHLDDNSDDDLLMDAMLLLV